MRLSTAPDWDDDRAIAVLHKALDAGVTLIDTADVYAPGPLEIGHNERLIARALKTWRGGDPRRVTVATKGGLTRPNGRWIPDGRRKSLEAACLRSKEALGFDILGLYQLHAVDPRVPLARSVRALAHLRERGHVERIGLCNVTVHQVEQALAITQIDSVQVALNPFTTDSIRNGVVEFCRDRGILLLAHTPLGGVTGARRLDRREPFLHLAQRHSTSPQSLALAWLRHLAPNLVPLPGATSLDSASRLAEEIRLTGSDRKILARELPGTDDLDSETIPRPPANRGSNGDVVIIMGAPAAGKSTTVKALVEAGYERLNRDLDGGTLRRLVARLDHRLEEGVRRVVLDNTYPKRADRRDVIETAWKHGLPVRCRWLTTSLEQAQINAVHRMIATFGRVLSPEEIKARSRTDPRALPPRALYRYRELLEPPTREEGYLSLEKIPFSRTPSPVGAHRGLLLEISQISADRHPRIRELHREGWKVSVLAWLPGASPERTVEQKAKLARELGIPFEFSVCPHPPGPPICWCRKPLPGRGITLIETQDLDPSRSLHVGKSPQDRSFAERLGIPYRDGGSGF